MHEDRTTSDEQLNFARAYVATTLGERAAAQAEPSLLADVFSSLARREELDIRHRDRWGNWDWPYGRAHLDGSLYRPFVDDSLRAALGAGDDPVRWPNSAPFALCLSHDLDDLGTRVGMGRAIRMARMQLRANGPAVRRVWQMLMAARRTLAIADTSGPELHRWIDLEASFGFRSTIFVVAPRLARPYLWDVHYSAQDAIDHRGKRVELGAFLTEAADAGWDIGLHGSIASATTAGLLGDERAQIERIVERPVTTTRQHFLRFDIRETPPLQAEAGLAGDSSLGFNRGVGFRSGSAFPHALWDWKSNQPSPVLEVPQHVMDGGLFTANALEYDTDLAVRHVIHLMDAVQAVGGCLTLSWHPNVSPKWWDVYPEVLAEAKRRGAWGCS
ncbi:MAG TPA: polysaccharide deacetylase family protein, partial [Gemmatimonadaceae bacterium]